MFNKVKTVGTISDFMKRDGAKTGLKQRINKRETLEQGILIGGSIPIACNVLRAMPASAEALPATATVATANADHIYNTMLHAFDPLVTLIQALAYPVAMVVVLGGALFIMIGNKEKGFTLMQGAGLGYVLVQLTPMILKILVEAMKSV